MNKLQLVHMIKTFPVYLNIDNKNFPVCGTHLQSSYDITTDYA